MKQLDIFNNFDEQIPERALDVPRQTHHFTLFVDGASRNNPGPSGAGIYLLRDSQVVCERGFYLGIKTNNQAEYLAFLVGFFFIADYYQEGDIVRVVSDSQLLVMQVNGKYKINNSALKPLHALAQKMVRLYGAHVVHVLRTENKHADMMANHGVDQKVAMPVGFIDLLRAHGIIII